MDTPTPLMFTAESDTSTNALPSNPAATNPPTTVLDDCEGEEEEEEEEEKSTSMPLEKLLMASSLCSDGSVAVIRKKTVVSVGEAGMPEECASWADTCNWQLP